MAKRTKLLKIAVLTVLAFVIEAGYLILTILAIALEAEYLMGTILLANQVVLRL